MITPDTRTEAPLQVTDLGRLAYAAAFEVQRRTHERVLAGEQPDTLLLVEHDPVITISQRTSAAGHLLASPRRLAELGIDVQPTDRGGDITYHGPGQLVAYPILRLAPRGLNLGRYMRRLEDTVLATVAAFGVQAHRVDGCTGVWVTTSSLEPSHRSNLSQPVQPAKPAKLCALGVRVRRNVTLHGLALNVQPDLSHFDTIVPCGLAGKGVTSLGQLLGERCPDMNQVKAALIEQFRRQFDG